MVVLDDQALRQLIIEALHLEGLSPEDKERVVGGLGEVIVSKLNVAIIDVLTHNERVKLLELADGDDDEVLRDFIKQKIPNLEQLGREVARRAVRDFQLKLPLFGGESGGRKI